MNTLYIQGMKCQHCVATAKKALEGLGATDVKIDVSTGEVHFAGTLDKEAVRQVIAANGFVVVDSPRKP